MTFQVESKASVLGYINAANGTNYTLNDIQFGTPVPTEGTWAGNNTSKNTAVRLTAPPGTTYQGSRVVTYDRLDIASLQYITGFVIKRSNPATVHDLLAAILYSTGIPLTTDDLEDSPCTPGANGTSTATLTAKAGSIGWFGSLAVTIYPGGLRLNDLIADNTLDGLDYPTASDQDVYGSMYLYPYDFTAYFDTLADIEEGVLTPDQELALVNMLKVVDISAGKTLWNNTAGSTSWSLAGATCSHSGLNGGDLPSNPIYKYVCAIDLRGDVSTPKGTLYMHYNDPVNTSQV